MARSVERPGGPLALDPYDHRAVEAKWQRRWAEQGSNRTPLEGAVRPYFNLMMFPYPSAEGLHVGNVYAYVGADAHGRWRRQQGDTVFEPIGFDAFGIDSENYALRIGEHPSLVVPRNVARFRAQLQRLGAMFDWDHAIDTTDPAFYRWTQWLFLRLHRAGLAEQHEALADWCPSCRTVLAGEQVTQTHCQRCGARIGRRQLAQWFLRITAYAEALLRGLDELDWPETVKRAQRQWIGRREGLSVRFPVAGCHRAEAVVFTERPETLAGATFLVVSAHHPHLDEFVTRERRAAVEAWRAYLPSPSVKPAVRLGVELGSRAIHPLTGAWLPLWAAPYVPAAALSPTGVVAAVPADDQRHYAFARAHGLPLAPASVPGRRDGEWAMLGPERARRAITERLLRLGLGERTVQYRLRDWLISRQRYWGPPIPVVYCPADGPVPLGERDLPVLLPKVDDFRPLGTGVSPLASAAGWIEAPCPRCGCPARRETDVFDNALDGAWHYLRYPSSELHDRPFDRERTWGWLPVDSYIGGGEHAIGHLLYARFVMRALYDQGLVPEPEPFTRFRSHGVLVSSGAKMAKSRGNVVDPDRYLNRHGTDTLRLYLMFMGPYLRGGDFRDEGIRGVARFLGRVWRAVQRADGDDAAVLALAAALDAGRERRRHALIAAVDRRMAALAYNTAIALLMGFARELHREALAGTARRSDAITLLQLLAPFAPHITEELWERCGQPGSVHDAPWPSYDPSLAAAATVTVPVMVAGRCRATIAVCPGTSADELRAAALALPPIVALLRTRQPVRVVAVPDRVVNLVLE